MNKNIFLIPFVVLLLFSCSDISTNGDDERDGGDRRERDRGDRDGDDRRNGEGDGISPVQSVCKGDSYTIYSHDECPDGLSVGDQRGGKSGRPAGAPVDILFVLDTSHSMYYYLNHAFEKRFKNFIPIINHLDWRMFFTNAGYSGGGFLSFFSQAMNGEAMKLENRYDVLDRRYLDRSVSGYKDVFNYTITREPERMDERGENMANECSYPPYCQGAEQPLRALHASFKANKHLTRKEADFVAIIVSNTDENPEEGANSITAKDITREFKSVYGSGKKLIILSVIILPDDVKCKKKNDGRQFLFPESNNAKKIASLASKIGGGNFSICLKDYSIVAKSIVNLTNK